MGRNGAMQIFLESLRRWARPVRRASCLIVLALVVSACQSAPPERNNAATIRQTAIRLGAELLGPPEKVFDTRDSCEQIDIPDAVPRAFRDDHNIVHLIATHFVARAMVGSGLDHVKHDCRVIYRSPHDPDPSHFLDANWIDSFYTEDGHRVAALAHTEYHGDEYAGMCGDMHNPNRSQDCAWTTITFAESGDGGYSFREPAPPANLVASLPYRYDKYNRGGAQGYDSPTNIVNMDGYYYSLINVWREYKAQRYGPCLIRTNDLYNASSWRAWNGTGFAVRFINPYTESNFDPAQHVCQPVVEGTIDSLAVDQRTGVVLANVYVEDNRYGRGPGLYLMAARDLLHWSEPVLVASTDALLAREPSGHWSYLYFTLLDPRSRDRNFVSISDSPYIYYVRLDDDHGPYARVLFRQQVKISLSIK